MLNLEKIAFAFTLASVLFFNISFSILGSLFGVLSAISWAVIAIKSDLVWLFRLNLILFFFNGFGLTKFIFSV